MPIKNNHICVFDFETTSLDTSIAQPVEIAARIYNERSLEPIPGAEFNSLCRPSKDCKIDYDKLFEITKITKEEVESATPIEIIYPQFINFLLKYNPEQNKWTAPIPGGHNIKGYDLPIHSNMMSKFCKKEKFSFNEIQKIDLMEIAYMYFSDTQEASGYSLNAMRDFFGISKEGAHRAMKDVLDSGWIIAKVLKFQRSIMKKYLGQMKGSFKKKDLVVA